MYTLRMVECKHSTGPYVHAAGPAKFCRMLARYLWSDYMLDSASSLWYFCTLEDPI